MNKINVLVTGAGGGGIGEQVIKCLKLSTLNYNIIATDITSISKGKIDGDKFIVAPLATSPDYFSFIRELCLKENINVIIPGSEIELKIFSANKDAFEAENIKVLINSSEVIDICLNKSLTDDFLKNNNFFSPLSYTIAHTKDLEGINDFPVVLKPSVGGGGSVNTLIAQNADELKVFGKFLLDQYKEFIAQEYVGDAESEYTVGVLSNVNEEIIDSIILKRNILSGLGSKIKLINNSGKSALGKYLVISSGISQGEIIRNKIIADVCESIAVKLKSTGPLNIQCRLVENKVYVFEINPRFSGTSPMRALAGFNEVEISIKNKLLNDISFPRSNYKLGHVVRGLVEYFV